MNEGWHVDEVMQEKEGILIIIFPPNDLLFIEMIWNRDIMKVTIVSVIL